MADLVSGDTVEAVMREKLEGALATFKKALDSEPTVDGLIETLNALVPLVKDAIRYNDTLDCPHKEIQRLETLMRAGEEPVRKCSKYSLWRIFSFVSSLRRDLMETLSNMKQNLEIYMRRLASGKCHNDLDEDDSDIINVRSQDNVVFPMDMAAATTQSGVLRDLIELIENGDEIPLPRIYHDTVAKMIAFCEQQHNFNKRLKDLMHSHETWLARFVTINLPVFPELHRAADFLNIPNLLRLTSETMGAMRENDPEQISEWYLRSSMSLMLLSPGVGEDDHHHVHPL